MRTIKKSSFFIIVAIAIIIFIFAVITTPAVTLLATLNSIFLGVGIVVVILFRRDIGKALLGHGDIDDIRLMTMMLIVGAIGAATGRIGGTATITTKNIFAYSWYWTAPISALQTYLFILAGVGMIFAHKLDTSYHHGCNKPAMWTAAAIGLTMSLITLYLQLY